MGASGDTQIGATLRSTPVTQPDLSNSSNVLTLPLSGDANISFTQGTGANQIDTVWHDRILSTDTFDLQVLTDFFGLSFGFSLLKVVYIKNRHATADVNVHGDVGTIVTPWANDIVTIGPGGILFMVRPDAIGWPVISSNKDIEFARVGGGAAVDLDFVLGGVRV
jgi:hypothetical protein